MSIFFRLINNIRHNLFLIYQLAIVEITNAYKKSYIGLSWAIITPLIAVLAWVLLNGMGVIQPGFTTVPYPIYVLISTSIWSFFHSGYTSVSSLFINGGRLMLTTKFPHEVLIVQQVIVHCFNFLILFLLNLIVLLIYGIELKLNILLFPFTLIPLLLLCSGIGLVVSLLRVVAYDLSKIIDHFMTFMMFLTPVVYSPKIQLAIVSSTIKYNPLTYLIGTSRYSLIGGEYYDPKIYFICCISCVLVFIFCVNFFLKHELKLVERLINN